MSLFYITPNASLCQVISDHSFVKEWAEEVQTKHGVKTMVSITCLQSLGALGEATTPTIFIVNRYLHAVHTYIRGFWADFMSQCSEPTKKTLEGITNLLEATVKDTDALIVQAQHAIRDAQGNKEGVKMVLEALDVAESSHANPLVIFAAGTREQKRAYLSLMNLFDGTEADRMACQPLNALIEALL